MKPISRRSTFVFYLLSNSDTILSSLTIATLLGVSIRSVKNSIHELKQVQDNLGIQVISIHAKGYQIVVDNPEVYKSVKLQYSIEYNSFNHHDLAGRSRSNSIIRTLLLQESYMTLDNLEKAIFLSQSTIKQVINNVRQKLMKFNLELLYLHRSGYLIKGSEINIRMCAVEMYELHHHQAISTLEDDSLNRHFEPFMKYRNTLRHTLLEQLFAQHLSMIDTLTQRLSLYLTISLQRIPGHPCTIRTSFADEHLDMSRAMSVATTVFEKIRSMEFFDSDIDLHSEIRGFAMLIMTFSDVTADDPLDNWYPSILTKVKIMAAQSSDNLRTTFNLSKDIDLNKQLVPAFIPIFYKLTFSKDIKTAIFGSSIEESEIKKSPLAVSFSIVIKDYIESRYHLALDDYTTSILAVSIHQAINDVMIACPPKRIVISSKNGKNASMAIKNQIQRLFPASAIETILIAELFEVRHLDLENYDFMILGFAQYTYSYSLPFVQISQVLSSEDIYAIQCMVYDNSKHMKALYHELNMASVGYFDHIDVNSMMDLMEMLAMRYGTSNEDIKQIKRALQQFISPLLIRNKICFIIIPDQSTQANRFEFFRLDKPFKWQKQDIAMVVFCRVSFNQSAKSVKALGLSLINLSMVKDLSFLADAERHHEILLNMNSYLNR